MINKWSKDDIDFLIKYYPVKGKIWCCEKLNKKECSVRQKASILGLRLNINSDFFKDFQKRAALGRVGKSLSDYHKNKISIANKGKKVSDETKFNIHVAQKKRFQDFAERVKASNNTKKWIKEKGHPKGMLGKKHKDSSIKKALDTKLKRYGTLNFQSDESVRKALKTKLTRYGKVGFVTENTYSRCKRGWRVIGGKKYFFRSKWEMNYAHYLQWLKDKKEIKDWEYEADTFWFLKIKRGVRSYIPDFKIFNNDNSIEYHEVKGWMDSKSKTKLKRMKKYYPEIKLILIDEDIYKNIKKWSMLIDDWED